MFYNRWIFDGIEAADSLGFSVNKGCVIAGTTLVVNSLR